MRFKKTTPGPRTGSGGGPRSNGLQKNPLEPLDPRGGCCILSGPFSLHRFISFSYEFLSNSYQNSLMGLISLIKKNLIHFYSNVIAVKFNWCFTRIARTEGGIKYRAVWRTVSFDEPLVEFNRLCCGVPTSALLVCNLYIRFYTAATRFCGMRWAVCNNKLSIVSCSTTTCWEIQYYQLSSICRWSNIKSTTIYSTHRKQCQ